MGKGCIGGWFCAFAGLCRDLKSESRLFTKTVKNDRDDMVKIYKNRPTQRFSSVENMETSYQCFPADWFQEYNFNNSNPNTIMVKKLPLGLLVFIKAFKF